jgi:UPF0176 protein
MSETIQIIAFYEFKEMNLVGDLIEIKAELKAAMSETGVRGTVIMATEGYNGMVCGTSDQIALFVGQIEKILSTKLQIKTSFDASAPFRKIDVKIKPEIVTLKKPVDVSLGRGTHVPPEKWNEIISDPETLVLDTRNDYEFQTGTFKGALNPNTIKFSDLPDFVAENLDPERHKKVAMFCTGGIRCEKFAPYMKQLGFDQVFQLEGGILKYLEKTPVEDSLWEGECFVFDERVTVDANLKKGSKQDLSQRLNSRKKEKYKVGE